MCHASMGIIGQVGVSQSGTRAIGVRLQSSLPPTSPPSQSPPVVTELPHPDPMATGSSTRSLSLDRLCSTTRSGAHGCLYRSSGLALRSAAPQEPSGNRLATQSDNVERRVVRAAKLIPYASQSGCGNLVDEKTWLVFVPVLRQALCQRRLA